MAVASTVLTSSFLCLILQTRGEAVEADLDRSGYPARWVVGEGVTIDQQLFIK